MNRFEYIQFDVFCLILFEFEFELNLRIPNVLNQVVKLLALSKVNKNDFILVNHYELLL